MSCPSLHDRQLPFSSGLVCGSCDSWLLPPRLRVSAVKSFWFRRFPQFDPVAFRVHNPGKAPVLMVFALGIDGHAFAAQSFQHRIQVFYLVVDHEWRGAGVEVLGVLRKDRPFGDSFLRRVFRPPPGKHRAFLRLALDAQMLLVPLVHLLRVFGLKENAAQTADALFGIAHVTLQYFFWLPYLANCTILRETH